MNFFWLSELISSVAGSRSAFGIRIQEPNRMRIHADPDLKHWAFFDETPEEKYEAETISVIT
jgi:hypothetical protein